MNKALDSFKISLEYNKIYFGEKNFELWKNYNAIGIAYKAYWSI